VLFKKLFWINVFESYMLCEQMVDNSKVEFKGLRTRYNFVLDFFAYVAWSLFNVKDLLPKTLACYIILAKFFQISR
jgi:hypothetical protein